MLICFYKIIYILCDDDRSYTANTQSTANSLMNMEVRLAFRLFIYIYMKKEHAGIASYIISMKTAQSLRRSVSIANGLRNTKVHINSHFHQKFVGNDGGASILYFKFSPASVIPGIRGYLRIPGIYYLIGV